MELDTIIAIMDGTTDNPYDKKFRTLYEYIEGSNDKNETMDMNAPVIDMVDKLEGKKYKHTMCFWAGIPWEKKDLPAPLSDDIFEMEMMEKEVYVR